MKIEIDDLSRPQVQDLLSEHLANMYEITPVESVHALNAAGLRDPTITFWTIWDGDALVGCGALRELSAISGEIKSMRTPVAARRRGAGRAMLNHIIDAARARGYTRLSLETGAMAGFEPARQLYRSAGFREGGPFGEYAEDPNSVFMHLEL